MKARFLAVVWGIISASASAQFRPEFFQKDEYWNDGKAEFNTYDAQIVRYEIPRKSEVIHIVVREPFDPQQLVKPDDPERPGTMQVLKLNQILHVQTGMYVYQQMHSSFWVLDTGRLIKWSLTSNDSCGNTWKAAERWGKAWTYEYRTYWDGMASGKESFPEDENMVFADELPLLVRTIDFNKSEGLFEIRLQPSVIHSKRDPLKAAPATVRFVRDDKGIQVTVESQQSKSKFLVDGTFPHLLRSATLADGSTLRLKRTLKIDYWNRNKPEDEALLRSD